MLTVDLNVSHVPADESDITETEQDGTSTTSPLSPISPWPSIPSPRARRRASTTSYSQDQQHPRHGLAPVHERRDEVEGGDDVDPTIDTLESDSGPEPVPAPVLPSAPEVYGSIAVLFTYAAYVLYLIWAFAPAGWLDTFGWTWYPDREWAIIVPCYLMFIVLLTYWTYAGLTSCFTEPFDSMALITDPYANIPAPKPGVEPYYHKFASEQAIPEAVDLPIDLVNRVLYPPRSRPRRAG